MACCNNMKSRYYKSAVETYSNTTQTFDATQVGGAVLTFTTTPTNTGCAITPATSGATIGYSGLYLFSVNVTLELVTGPGNVVVQLYRDGQALPCCQATESMLANDVDSFSVTTVLPVNACQATNPTFTVVVTSPTATEINVTHSALTVVKLA